MTPTPTLREALEEARQHVEFIADGGVESVAQLRAAIDLLPRIDAALSTPEPQGWRPIDEAPKDGTEMFVVGELGWHAADAVTAYFDDRGRGCWRDKHGDRLEWEPEYFHTLNLPEPPK